MNGISIETHNTRYHLVSKRAKGYRWPVDAELRMGLKVEAPTTVTILRYCNWSHFIRYTPIKKGKLESKPDVRPQLPLSLPLILTDNFTATGGQIQLHIEFTRCVLDCWYTTFILTVTAYFYTTILAGEYILQNPPASSMIAGPRMNGLTLSAIVFLFLLNISIHTMFCVTIVSRINCYRHFVFIPLGWLYKQNDPRASVIFKKSYNVFDDPN